MEINVRDGSKIVEVWLANSEKHNEELRKRLRTLYREYQAKKYLVAVFESGERDVCGAVGDLLCYNRKRIAQLEVEREKQGGAAAP